MAEIENVEQKGNYDNLLDQKMKLENYIFFCGKLRKMLM
jgi:hypothetical protein